MTPEHQIDNFDARRERVKLVAFAALMLLAGAGLAAVGGPPRLPADMPRWGQVVATLSGSTLPLEPLALLLLDLAWLLWTWIVGSLCLELFVAAAEAAAHGAAWVGSLRNVANRLSLPVVRRAVAAAFAVQVLSRGVSVAAAQPVAAPAETALVEQASAESTATRTTPAREAPDAPTYLVRPGDTLWSISERAYGSGMHYRRLIDANLGRRMPDGLVFLAQGVIQPGWDLVVPDAMPEVEVVDGERWYTVRPGDTLSAIAARLLGDQARWSDLFDLNSGATSPDGSHVFVDADVIWPGLRLCLPADRTPVDGTDPSPEPGTPADGGETVGMSAVDLVVASAAAANAPPAAAEIPAPQVPFDGSSGETDPPPLLRTPHAQEPVVLEPSDTAGAPEASLLGSGDVSPLAQERAFAPFALGGLGLAAAAGVVLGVRRTRRLRRLPQEPESEVVVEGGFAEAQLAQDFTRGIHGVGFDPTAALVHQVEKFLREYNLTNPGVVALRHGRSATTITLKASLAEQPILLDLAPVLAERLQAEAEASVSADQDVVVRLSRLRRTRLLPTADALLESPCLVPLGVLYDRQVYSAAWNSLGHVLVASLPGHGADTILTSLVATLTARRSPEELRVWIVGSSRSLPAPVFDLPHLARVIDPTDTAALHQAAADLRAELDRRAGLQQAAEDLQAELDRRAAQQEADVDLRAEPDLRAAQQPLADLVLVVPELTSIGEHAAAFELLVSREADLGVRLVAATTCPEEALASPLLAHFGTRMVLRMQEEEASVALLGVADAVFLGGGGRLLLRLDGREPVELYGYQVPAEHLERLVRVMRSAYPSGSHSMAATVTPPDQQRLVPPGSAQADERPAARGTQADHGPAVGLARQADDLVMTGGAEAAHVAATGGSTARFVTTPTAPEQRLVMPGGAQPDDLPAAHAIQADHGTAAGVTLADHGTAAGAQQVEDPVTIGDTQPAHVAATDGSQVADLVSPPDRQRLVTHGTARPDDLPAARGSQADHDAAAGVARHAEDLGKLGGGETQGPAAVSTSHAALVAAADGSQVERAAAAPGTHVEHPAVGAGTLAEHVTDAHGRQAELVEAAGASGPAIVATLDGEAKHISAAGASKAAKVAALGGQAKDVAALGSSKPEGLAAFSLSQAADVAALGGGKAEGLAASSLSQAADVAALGGGKAEGLAASSLGQAVDVAWTGGVQAEDRATDGAAETVKCLSVEATNASLEVTRAKMETVAVARPPIEVICFGGPHVLCGGMQVWPRMPGGEAKPWELLLYLACQPAEGVSSEDAVEALWPEDDSADDPPHRFRQLRYRLRRALADLPGAPDSDGICLDRGVLRLDPGVVYSDAQEFLSLLRSGRITPGAQAIDYLERARALYLGDLLHGPDARRYAWVDERDPSGVTLREHFRRLYQQASARLADLYASNKEFDAALDLYRELTEIDPGDERLWLALFRLHVDRGDRLGLVREEHRMRTAFRELAVEIDQQGGVQLNDPSRETALEYQRLLASLHGREREPATA